MSDENDKAAEVKDEASAKAGPGAGELKKEADKYAHLSPGRAATLRQHDAKRAALAAKREKRK